MQYCVFSCKDAHDCKLDPAMAGLGIRLYYITIEGSDAAGNIGRDQCRVIIIPRNMTIQDVDAIVQKSNIRYPVSATADLGIMLETKTNIILKYMYDLGQAQINAIKATQSATNSAARARGLIESDEGGDLALLVKQREKIEVELWMVVATVVCCVGFGFLGGVGAFFLVKNLPK